MDLTKTERIFNSINSMIVAEELDIEETYTIGLNLILSTWSVNPDKEELVDSYIECTSHNLREIMKKILEKERKE